MSTFIESCCCHGIQPKGVVEKRRIARPEVVGLLLKDRSVPRFIIAPDGYGKTHVAFEYAGIMFAFEGVIWIRCSSPCFIRDLDSSHLCAKILTAQDKTALVVFDGLPTLDPGRTRALSDAIDELLEASCEVIVACTPAADTFAACQQDRILVTSHDLLLDETLLEAMGEEPLSHRNIPCMAWSRTGMECLLEGWTAEEMPADVRMAIFSFLAVGSGDGLSLLSLFEAKRAQEMLGYLHEHYTYLGIDAETGRFKALAVPVDKLKDNLQASLDDLALCTSLGTGDALGCHIADALCGEGDASRACNLLARFVTPSSALVWLKAHGWQILCSGAPLAVASLVDRLKAVRASKAATDLQRAYALMILGQDDEAIAGAKRVLKLGDSQQEERVGALCLLIRCTLPHGDQGTSLKLAEELSGQPIGASDPFDLPALARLIFPLSLGELPDPAVLEEVHHVLEKRPASQTLSLALSQLLGCVWILEALGMQERERKGGEMDDPRAVGEKVLDLAASCLERVLWSRGAQQLVRLPLALMSLDAAIFKALTTRLGGDLRKEVPAVAAKALVSLQAQRRLWTKAQEEQAQKRHAFDAAHPDAFRLPTPKPSLMPASAPQLEVRMFGGLEVRIDGEMVDPRKLSRKRTRTLASVLALNKGREISRERLCQLIWPDMDAEECRNSFYSIWASLKKALSLEGRCPYLIRSQSGCSLDARYLSTDMESFDATCSSLVFGGGEDGNWEDLYLKVTTLFSGELLPTETECDYVKEIRERCRSRLVDGLIAASLRLARSEEHTGSLWFAREALRRDSRREDVHIALMEAQIAADQRGPALETYFQCRRFLAEDLGIDPSPKLVGLYRSIIEYEEAL